MRILLVSEDIPYPQMGGLAKHVLALARALVRAGHEVDLLGGNAHPIEAAGEEGKFGGRFFGELDGHDIGWKEKKLGVFVPSRRTWVARRFARVILRHAGNYDVVHYHGHAANIGHFIPAGINFVQTRHDQGADCLVDIRFKNGRVCNSTSAADCARCRTPDPNALQTAVSVIAVKRYRAEVAEGFLRHKTVFVSGMLLRNFSRTMGARQWGIVLHNFADREGIERARRAASAMPPLDAVTVFVAGKLYSAKGVEPFLQELVPRIPAGVKVLIAGDGPDLARLRETFEGERIRFLGWCSAEQTLELAARASVIVVPSVCEESCSTTVLEGLLLAKPTFALARGGTPELAMYASYPNQLRLHQDMRELVDDLVGFTPAAVQAEVPQERASADLAARRLLDVYAQPRASFLSREGENAAFLWTV